MPDPFQAGGHEERNFAFTELGTYDITITAEATRTENGLSQDFNATETFTFQVIPEPSSALLYHFLKQIGLIWFLNSV